jgi:hypothetical protein
MRTWKTNTTTPCKELQIAKRYLNTIVSRLKTSNPNTHVSPSNGSSMADPLRPTFTFLNNSWAEALAVVVFPPCALSLTWLEDRVFRKARTKTTTFIWIWKEQKFNYQVKCLNILVEIEWPDKVFLKICQFSSTNY